MGVAEAWQDRVINMIDDREINVNVYNPRRTDWDSSWAQDISNPKFVEQVQWELMGLELADEIVMYFDPSTKSPVTLLELGLWASSAKLTVICPDGFWRKGNVDIVCQTYDIEQMDSLELYIDWLEGHAI